MHLNHPQLLSDMQAEVLARSKENFLDNWDMQW